MTSSPGAGPAFVAAFGPMHVINLPHRRDRRREFSAQLARIGLSLDHPQVRVHAACRPDTPAGFPSIGARGCFLSHLGLLRGARDAGLDSLVVCEDDLDFAPDFNDRVPTLLPSLTQGDWSLCYAGHAGLSRDLPTGPSPVPPARGVKTTHFMIMRRNFFLPLIPYLEAILTRPPGHPDGGPMHVDGAISRFRADHPDLSTLAVFPPLGLQRPSRTDIHPLRWYDRLPAARYFANLFRRYKQQPRTERTRWQ